MSNDKDLIQFVSDAVVRSLRTGMTRDAIDMLRIYIDLLDATRADNTENAENK